MQQKKYENGMPAMNTWNLAESKKIDWQQKKRKMKSK